MMNTMASTRRPCQDFAHMAAVRPGCFVLMGNGTEGAHARPLHAANYDFNDDALVLGSSLWAQIALDAAA